MQSGKLILVGLILGFTILACSLFSPQAVPKPESTLTATVIVSDTAPAVIEPSSTLTDTSSPAETATTQAPTAAPMLTSTPEISATLPALDSTFVAQQTIQAATEGVQLKTLSGTLLSQCPNPSDPPMQNWVNIPVMPQATAGQVVKTLIGSYYCFRAPVTVDEMETFYKQRLLPPNWVMQSDSNGSMVFIGVSQTGFQFLSLGSGLGNKNDLIVAINITNPMSISTPKP